MENIECIKKSKEVLLTTLKTIAFVIVEMKWLKQYNLLEDSEPCVLVEVNTPQCIFC